jgi:hypothetical protein
MWHALGIVAATVLLHVAPALAGTPAPDLAPEHGFWGLRDDAYAGAVADALLGSAPRRTCQMVFLPSFRKENAVYLVRGRRGAATVVATEARRQIWGQAHDLLWQGAEGNSISTDEFYMRPALARVSRAVEKASAPLDSQTAGLLERVWAQMLARTRVPPEHAFGLDGVTYHAAQFEVCTGYRCGMTWSPAEGARARDFVDLAVALQRYARSGQGERAAIRRELRSRAEALLARIAEANRKDPTRAPASAPRSRKVPPAPCDIKWRPPDPNDCATCPTKAMRETKPTRGTK